MPLTEMKLGTPQGNDVEVPVWYGEFATRALAVIAVHDSMEDDEARPSLRRLVELEDYLGPRITNPAIQYLIAFGRHGEPLLHKYLLETLGYNEEKMNYDVATWVAKLKQKLREQ